MDLKICGLIDIILVLLILLVLFLGYRKGFLKKAIGMIGLFVGLAIAFVFCTQLAGWFESTGFIYNSIFHKIETNVLGAEIFQTASGEQATIADVLMNIGVPKFLANMFASNIAAGTTVETIASNIAGYFAHILMVIISFVILFIGVFILSILLKIISSILRGNGVIRFIDGVLGMALYFCLFMVLVYAVFAILRYMGNYEFFAGCQKFLDVDMKLKEDTFRLSKFFYQNNIIYAFFDMLF